VRGAVSRVARRAGLHDKRADDFLLAVNEAATNSIVHGGGTGVLRAWAAAGRLTCEVRDHGRISDPLAGRRTPAPTDPGGRGMWLMHQICDIVEVRTGHAGTAVRLHLAAD
jgi:anti-sigma regulatory factor (Ser/Thr protein kinase)